MLFGIFMMASPFPMVSGYGGDVDPYDNSLSCRDGFTVVIRANNPDPICLQIPTAEKWVKNGLASYPDSVLPESSPEVSEPEPVPEEITQETAPLEVEKEEALELLFVQTAKSAELKPIFGAPYTHKFFLYDVSPTVIYFSDRPYRISGLYNLTDFMQIWYLSQDSFSIDPPNVAIETYAGGIPTTIIAELSSPMYNPDTKTMVYNAKISSDGKIPAKLDSVALFIDNWFTKTWHHIKHSVSHDYHKIKHEVDKVTKKVVHVAKKVEKTSEKVGKQVYEHAKDHPLETAENLAEDYAKYRKDLTEEAAQDAKNLGEHSAEDLGELTKDSIETAGEAGLDEIEGKGGAAQKEWEKGGKELNKEAEDDAEDIGKEGLDDTEKIGKHALSDACDTASDAGTSCGDVESDYEGKHESSSKDTSSTSKSESSTALPSTNVREDSTSDSFDPKFTQQHKQWSGNIDTGIEKAANLAYHTFQKQEQKGISTTSSLKSQLDTMQTQLEDLLTQKQQYQTTLSRDAQDVTAKKDLASIDEKISALEESIKDLSSKKDKAESDLKSLRKGLEKVAEFSLEHSHGGDAQ
ncbi:MAG: hypothetical protein DWQ18_06000 [Crenarchaeota archaeon]|nr:MAG: hypothetical protein DWQ18_06000 [Thermoproteota archaeon]RDJ38087.1 MAG: hypothetical protein DWQ19_01175 [Thermoproteota archaeon]